MYNAANDRCGYCETLNKSKVKSQKVKAEMLKLNHKNLEIWKQSVLLVKEIYRATKEFPKEEQSGITNQLRRAAVSVVSNIAEGSARSSMLERKRFYEIARSIVEIDTQLEISISLEIIRPENLVEVEVLLNNIFAMLSGLIKSQNPD